MIALTIFEADAFTFLAEQLLEFSETREPLYAELKLIIFMCDGYLRFKTENPKIFQYIQTLKVSCVDNIGFAKFTDIVFSEEFFELYLHLSSNSPSKIQLKTLKETLQKKFFANRYKEFEGLSLV